jgi:hypothetical protein
MPRRPQPAANFRLLNAFALAAARTDALVGVMTPPGRLIARFGPRFLFAALSLGLLLPLPAETGPERAERLLTALGGREAWAGVQFVHVEAVHDQLNLRDPFTNRIWNDFTQPRVRFEARGESLDRRRVIADGVGRAARDGVPRELTAQEVADELRWWEANIYRTLHRLAIGDPALTPQAVGDHRLEILLPDGRRLNWFLLNQRGEPHLFGTWDSENGGAMGPPASNGTIKYPRWGAMPDGSWRYEIRRFVTAGSVPPEIDFKSP